MQNLILAFKWALEEWPPLLPPPPEPPIFSQAGASWINADKSHPCHAYLLPPDHEPLTS